MFEMDAPYKNVAQHVVFTGISVKAPLSASFLGTKSADGTRWFLTGTTQNPDVCLGPMSARHNTRMPTYIAVVVYLRVGSYKDIFPHLWY
jgi:hypothetical protein